jgi:hypothetical protein
LNKYASVIVAGVGSFSAPQLDGILSISQSISSVADITSHTEENAGIKIPPGVCQPYYFFHVAGDIVGTCCRSGLSGRKCLFNAGSLLSVVASEDLQVSTIVWKQALIEKLRSIGKEYGVVLGVYVQEHIIDKVALNSVIRLVNTYPDVFPAGFAYGSVLAWESDSTDIPANSDTVPSKSNSINVGLGLQKVVGRSDLGFWCY